MKAKKWVLVKAFEGEPKDSDIELQEEELQPLKEGEVLCEAEYLSVDPYMRPYMAMAGFPLPYIMMGQQLAKVTESRNKDYPVGTYLLAPSGWRSHTVLNPAAPASPGRPPIFPLPEMGDLPRSLALGALGMPGFTAYFGLLRLCEPKEGETVLVNAAAGAVGSMVGQIAKIKGCRVVGCAGSDDKCKWLKELGFDYVFNYKTQDVATALKEGAPEGIDCYFDNVGGMFTLAVLGQMKLFGRVAICGAISGYNDIADKPSSGPFPWAYVLFKQLTVRGFIVQRWLDEYPTAFKDLTTWMREGRLQYREHMTEGFRNMRKAFYGLLKGENTGKAVVRAEEPAGKGKTTGAEPAPKDAAAKDAAAKPAATETQGKTPAAEPAPKNTAAKPASAESSSSGKLSSGLVL